MCHFATIVDSRKENGAVKATEAEAINETETRGTEVKQRDFPKLSKGTDG